MTNKFEVSPASFDLGPTAGPSDFLHLTQMQGFRINTNITDKRVRVAGNVDSQAHHLSRAEASASLQTQDLASVLARVPFSGGICVGGPGGALFREQQRDECGTFKTGADHITHASPHGFLHMESLSVDDSNEEPASISLMHCALSPDSQTAPYTSVENVDFSNAVTHPPAAFLGAYYLGGVYHNSVLLKGTISVSIEFGLTVAKKPQTPGPFPTISYITDRDITVKMKLEDQTFKASHSLFGSAVQNEFAIYLQKSATDARVAANLGQHIKIALTAGKINIDDTGGDAAADSDTNVTVKNVGPITASVGTTIPS